MDTLPTKRNSYRTNRSLTLPRDFKTLRIPSKRNTHDMIGIEYNQKISLDQIIEYKKRSRKLSLKSTSNLHDVTISKENPFSEEFYESIENFLDERGMFIFDPTPSRSPKAYLKIGIVTCDSDPEDNDPLEQEPATCLIKHSEMSNQLEGIQLNKLHSNNIDSEAKTQAKKKGSFLGNVSTSSLIQRRKKNETTTEIKFFKP